MCLFVFMGRKRASGIGYSISFNRFEFSDYLYTCITYVMSESQQKNLIYCLKLEPSNGTIIVQLVEFCLPGFSVSVGAVF
jgi:hypothetical protein